jgi:hypothetical protein
MGVGSIPFVALINLATYPAGRGLVAAPSHRSGEGAVGWSAALIG